MKRINTFVLLLLLIISHRPVVSAEDIDDTDHFYDDDCESSKNRILSLANTLIAAGWEMLHFGYNPGDSFLRFAFALDQTSLGDDGEFRMGDANFDKCNSDEFDNNFLYTYDVETNQWIVDYGSNSKSSSVTVDWSLVAAGVLITVVVVGILAIYVYSGGTTGGGGGGGSCSIGKINPIPTYGICP